jgi:murein DD-endopeptidase MepM/ murein hydrolase activator NlpD
MKKIIFLIILVLAAAITIIFWPETLGLKFLEKKAPQISLKHENGSILLSISDESGISNITVKSEQNGQTTELLNKNYDSPVKSDELNINYSKLPEGKASITAVVKDAAFWKNKAEANQEVLIDYSPPKVRLLSLQHVAAQGGAEFVVYSAEDSNLESHGVKVDGNFFPGFKIEDAGVSPVPNTYVSLFALPLGYANEASPAEISVKDTAGNEINIPLHFRLEKKSQADVQMKLKEDYLNAKAAELFPGYLKASAGTENASAQKPADVPENLWKFKLINRNYRDLLDAELKKLFESSTLPRQWKEVFMKPMPSATSSTFGEKRTYSFNGLDGGYSVHNGLDLASVDHDKVFAANNGIVVLSKEFGIYGNAIVIDHGLGLFSLYGHLSSSEVKINDKVTRGQEIGRTGQTGLAGGDHLHFEFRLRNVPVTPIEWWDSKWIKDNIDGKLADLQ